MTPPARTVLLFDNSALNHLFGQSPSIDDGMREAVTTRMRAATAATPESLVVLVTDGLIGELAGLFFSNPHRFEAVVRFVFETAPWRLLRPALDDARPSRMALELVHHGRAPWESVTYPRREAKWLAHAFLDAKRSTLDTLAADASARKKKFADGERERRADAQQAFEKSDQKWDAEFRGWDADPWPVVDEWTLFAMNRLPRFYGLPSDRARWPKPRDFVTLWYARAYHTARLHELFGAGRKCDDGGDLYDGMYFDDAAYADILVTADRTLERRARSLKLATPRVVGVEAWIADFTSRPSGATAGGT